MKKNLFGTLSILLSFLIACTSTKKLNTEVLNSWIGHSKEQFIEHWGPPDQTTSNGGDGEILVYAKRYYRTAFNTTVDYWEYKMIYVDRKGDIYHWLVKTNPNPPQRVDVRPLL